MTDLQISYFLKVTESMSFSKAARELFVSQPSVSRQIQQLEKELGYVLFDRHNKNTITLTPAGMVFRDSFRKMKEDLALTFSAAEEISSKERLQISIGIGEGWDFCREIGKFRMRAADIYPQAKIHLVQESFCRLRQMLLNGELDAIICTTTSIQNFEQLLLMPIGASHTIFYISRQLLSNCGREKPGLKELADFPLLMLPEAEASVSIQLVLLQFMAEHLRPEIKHLPNRSSIYQAVLLGEGFTPMDERMFFAKDERLYSLSTKEKIPLSIVCKKNNQNPLIRLLEEVFQEERGSRWKSDI